MGLARMLIGEVPSVKTLAFAVFDKRSRAKLNAWKLNGCYLQYETACKIIDGLDENLVNGTDANVLAGLAYIIHRTDEFERKSKEGNPGIDSTFTQAENSAKGISLHIFSPADGRDEKSIRITSEYSKGLNVVYAKWKETEQKKVKPN